LLSTQKRKTKEITESLFLSLVFSVTKQEREREKKTLPIRNQVKLVKIIIIVIVTKPTTVKSRTEETRSGGRGGGGGGAGVIVIQVED
jgi:hypothetical protein